MAKGPVLTPGRFVKHTALQVKVRQNQPEAKAAPRALTIELLDQRNRQPGSTEALREVRLDAEQLDSIPAEVTDALGSATHLYLQHNCFVDTRRLGGLPQLRFLSLAHNAITEVTIILPDAAQGLLIFAEECTQMSASLSTLGWDKHLWS